MVLIILSIAFIAFILSILLLPVVIAIDTNKNEYYVKLSGYARVQLIESAENWKIRLRILFISYTMDPFGNLSSKKFRTKEYKKGKKGNLLALPKSKKITDRIFRSVCIKKLIANIDTDDYQLNALLIPIAMRINQKNITVNINYEDQNTIDFKAITYLYKLIGIAIALYITNKK